MLHEGFGDPKYAPCPLLRQYVQAGRLGARRDEGSYGVWTRRDDEPVRLTRIYTRGGDAGETSLGDGSRVTKTDPRIAAYGTVDELNAALGRGRRGGPSDEYRPWLERIQNDLFDLGADLSVPAGDPARRLRVDPEQVAWLEGVCDRVNGRLEPLRSFVLPGGSEVASRLHVARTVCRRAERLAVELAAQVEVTPEALAYLNRLSDLLFILARACERAGGSGRAALEAGRISRLVAAARAAVRARRSRRRRS